MDKTTRKESMRLSEMNFMPVLIAIAVIFVTLGENLKFNYLIHVF